VTHSRAERSKQQSVASRLTGVLLVGGQSTRFGSPKALARFRGETLAARGQRLLAEVCDEVLVVGKAGELPDLPFAVLDDSASSRAPVHGVLAGLRHAHNDTVVVLPVDVPLVTPGALRALGEAVAVPSEGIPLPGAYPRSLLPVLEARIAAGELSLRGINPTTLQLPNGLLVDADTPDALARLQTRGHALVVGGTGMLASGTRFMARRGHTVTAIARHSIPLGPGVTIARLDYRDQELLTVALRRARESRGPIELAVCWIHTDAPEAPRVVADALAPGGRLVQVFGTRVWPLEDVPLHVAYRQVLLGEKDGRWLTHEEISTGLVEAIDADLPVWVVGERDERVSD
jgi:molybdopterin-guanine dinucleotide biosynthesis protein A